MEFFNSIGNNFEFYSWEGGFSKQVEKRSFKKKKLQLKLEISKYKDNKVKFLRQRVTSNNFSLFVLEFFLSGNIFTSGEDDV